MPLTKQLVEAKDLTTLSLKKENLTREDVRTVCYIIKNNPSLISIDLSYNDFRTSIIEIFKYIQDLSNIQELNIIDNNIDDSMVWEGLAKTMMIASTLTKIYIGAKRILGSSNGRHAVYVEDDKEKKYHNTGWEDGFYGTGYNEICRDGMVYLGRAVKHRLEEGKPFEVIYTISKERTYNQVSKRKGVYFFKKIDLPMVQYAEDSDTSEIKELLK